MSIGLKAKSMKTIRAKQLQKFSVIRISDAFGHMRIIMESLILAQNERWRRVLSMQVERQGTFGYPRVADW